MATARSYHQVAVVDGEIYAIGGAGTGGTVEKYTTPTAPTAPNNLTAIAGNSEVDLSWTAVTWATSYNVKRSTAAGGPYDIIAESVTEAVYTDTTVTNGTTYYYVVTAANSVGESANSNEVSATPMVPPTTPTSPTNLTAIAGDFEVDLSWTAVTGATSYNVKRSTTAGGPYTTIAENATETTYTDITVTNSTTYYYVVTAINSAGESANSNEALRLRRWRLNPQVER